MTGYNEVKTPGIKPILTFNELSTSAKEYQPIDVVQARCTTQANRSGCPPETESPKVHSKSHNKSHQSLFVLPCLTITVLLLHSMSQYSNPLLVLMSGRKRGPRSRDPNPF